MSHEALHADPTSTGQASAIETPQDVILPLTMLWRLDCVLAETKPRVLETQARLKDKLDNLDPQRRRASGFAVFRTAT